MPACRGEVESLKTLGAMSVGIGHLPLSVPSKECQVRITQPPGSLQTVPGPSRAAAKWQES